MEKLTLENVCNYLPYGLIVSTPVGIRTVFGYCTNKLLVRDGECIIEYCKPIYHPMDLTKTILIDDKELTPIVELAKIAILKVFRMLNYHDCLFYNITFQNVDFGKMIKFTHHDSIYKFICELDEKSSRYGFYLIRDNDIKYYLNQLQLFQWLYKNKFDVGGLIEKGIAIDVNTLDKNIYN